MPVSGPQRTPEPRELPTLADPAGVYRVYGGAVSAWARRLAGPEGDIEDLVHDVFEVAFRRKHAYAQEMGDLGAWLHGITVKVVLARRRKVRLRRYLTLGKAHDLPAPDATATPEQAAMRGQAQHHLYQLLDKLPENQRTAFILHDLESLEPTQIAQMTSTSVGNVWVRVHRARKTLAAGLHNISAPEEDNGADREVAS